MADSISENRRPQAGRRISVHTRTGQYLISHNSHFQHSRVHRFRNENCKSERQRDRLDLEKGTERKRGERNSLFRFFRLHDHKVEGEITHVTARIRTRRLLERHAGALETLEHDFEEFPLLRVHVRRLEVIDAEEAIVEGADVLAEEVPALGYHTTGPVHTVRMVEAIYVEPRRGHTARRGPALGYEFPELGGG